MKGRGISQTLVAFLCICGALSRGIRCYALRLPIDVYLVEKQKSTKHLCASFCLVAWTVAYSQRLCSCSMCVQIYFANAGLDATSYWHGFNWVKKCNLPNNAGDVALHKRPVEMVNVILPHSVANLKGFVVIIEIIKSAIRRHSCGMKTWPYSPLGGDLN